MKDSVKYNIQTALMESERTKLHGGKKAKLILISLFPVEQLVLTAETQKFRGQFLRRHPGI